MALPHHVKSHPIEALSVILLRLDLGDHHRALLADAFAELKHLREHLPRVQGVASLERDLRMKEHESRREAEVARDSMAKTLVAWKSKIASSFPSGGRRTADELRVTAHLHEATSALADIVEHSTGVRPPVEPVESLCKTARDATICAVRVVTRPAVVETGASSAPPVAKSERWVELEQRISAAVDAGQDADPADMLALLEEQTRVAGA